MLIFGVSSSDSVQSEEEKSYRDKSHEEDQDPHGYAANAQRLKVQEEIRIDQRGSGGGNHDGGVKLQNCGLNENEDRVCKREADGGNGIVPFRGLSFVEQKPIGYVHNGEHYTQRAMAA